jgi:hypothetical protein
LTCDKLQTLTPFADDELPQWVVFSTYYILCSRYHYQFFRVIRVKTI